MKLFSLAFLAILTCVLCLTTVRSTKPEAEAHKIANIPPQQPRVLIDGQASPEKIPDHLAYSLLFRLIARRATDVEKNRVRSYLKQAMGCNKCDKTTRNNNSHDAQESDINALIAAAEQFDQQVTILDKEVSEVNSPVRRSSQTDGRISFDATSKTLLDQSWPNVMARL